MPPSNTTPVRLGERVSFPHHEVTVEAPNTDHAQEVTTSVYLSEIVMPLSKRTPSG